MAQRNTKCTIDEIRVKMLKYEFFNSERVYKCDACGVKIYQILVDNKWLETD